MKPRKLCLILLLAAPACSSDNPQYDDPGTDLGVAPADGAAVIDGGGSADGGSGADTATAADAAPDPLPPMPTGFSARAAGFTSAVLSWDELAEVTAYRVFVDGVAGDDVAAPATGTTVDELVSGTTYAFALAACNEAGCGPKTTPVEVTLPEPLYDPLWRTPEAGDTLEQLSFSEVARTTEVIAVRTEGTSTCVDLQVTTGEGEPAPTTFTLAGDPCAGTQARECPDHTLGTVTLGGNAVEVDICSAETCSPSDQGGGLQTCSSQTTKWLRLPGEIGQFRVLLARSWATFDYYPPEQKIIRYLSDGAWSANGLDLHATLGELTELIKVTSRASGVDCYGRTCSRWERRTTDYYLRHEIPLLSHVETETIYNSNTSGWYFQSKTY
jgi:hypothetical protein